MNKQEDYKNGNSQKISSQVDTVLSLMDKLKNHYKPDPEEKFRGERIGVRK